MKLQAKDKGLPAFKKYYTSKEMLKTKLPSDCMWENVAKNGQKPKWKIITPTPVFYSSFLEVERTK